MLKTTSLYGTAISGTALLFMSGAAAQTSVAPQLAPQTASATSWVKSVKITAAPIQQSDLGMMMLGSQLWRFAIAGPKPSHSIDLILEFRKKGKPALLLVSATVKPQPGWPATGRLQILVGQSTSDDGLKAATRIRYLVQADGYTFASFVDGVKESGFIGPVLAMTSTDNPFKSLVQTDQVLEPRQRSDGSFVLLTGGISAVKAKDVPETALVFRVQEEALSIKQVKN